MVSEFKTFFNFFNLKGKSLSKGRKTSKINKNRAFYHIFLLTI